MQKPVAIVGAGLVGSGWGLVFARAGYPVRLFDPSASVRVGILPWAERSLRELATAGLVEEPADVLNRLTVSDTLEGAVYDAFYIQESVFETVELKTKVSLDIDAVMTPNAVVGSSSSGIPASRFTEGCKNRGRFLIAHPVNPPHLVPVVELVPAPWTDVEAMDVARRLMETVGQAAVTLTREIDGFILNRLQGALLMEAWALYHEGYASLADIDATISHGLGLRWSFMGPFETIDLNAPGGIADYAARLGPMYAGQVRNPPAGPWDAETVTRAEAERRAVIGLSDLAGRRDWRDRMLTKLAAFKRDAGLGV